MNILRSYLNCCTLLNWKQKSALILNRAVRGWGEGRFFLKASATLPLIKIYRMSLISAGSISLDSTFNMQHVQCIHCTWYIIHMYSLHTEYWRTSNAMCTSYTYLYGSNFKFRKPASSKAGTATEPNTKQAGMPTAVTSPLPAFREGV
jgi:hypothetical protein